MSDEKSPTLNTVVAVGEAELAPAPKAAEGPDIESMVKQAIASALEPYVEKQSDFVKKINREMKNRRLAERGVNVEGDASAETPTPPATNGAPDVEATALAAMRLGELKASLPSEQRDALAEATNGLSLQERLRMYELASSLAPASKGAKPSGPGRQGGPSSSNAAIHPKSQAEFIKLSKERRDALVADPTFHLDELPQFV